MIADAPLYSPLSADPDLAGLVDLFLAELPARRQVLQNSFANGDCELLARTAHQLKGAGGSYGFPAVTWAAAQLEQAVRSGQSPARTGQYLDELLAVFDRCSAGVKQ